MGGVGRMEGREWEVFCIWKRVWEALSPVHLCHLRILFFYAECLIILTRQEVISQNSYRHSFSCIITSVKTFTYTHNDDLIL